MEKELCFKSNRKFFVSNFLKKMEKKFSPEKKFD